MAAPEPLSPAALYRRCDESLLDFRSAADLPALDQAFGQARAHEALHFAVDMPGPGYNVFVMGESGSGRHGVVRRLLERRSAGEPCPGDWCHVHSFGDATRPRALPLPAGRGARLRDDMRKFVLDMSKAIPAALDSDDFRQRIEAIQQEYKQREEEALQSLGRESADKGLGLLRTPHGFVFAPMKGEEPYSGEEYNALPEEEQKRYTDLMEEFGERLRKLLAQLPRWRREMQHRMREATREALALAVGHLIDELQEGYRDLPEVLAYLDEVRADVVEVGENLREQTRTEGEATEISVSGEVSLLRYQVNLLVDRGGQTGSPVVFEDNPTLANLVGRIDQVVHEGTLVSNFTLIRAGALHRANGGFLVLDALKVLQHPMAWEGLKRALRTQQVKIESLAQAAGFAAGPTLEPQPIPLAVKVVLVGERYVHYLLRELDPEYEALFKVAADFVDEVKRDGETTQLYARLIGALARHRGLPPVEPGAVARLVEQAARRASDAERLSTHTRWLADMLAESGHVARKAGAPALTRAHVDQALAARLHRADRLHHEILDAMLRGTLLISTEGSHVGQTNGLAVLDLGEHRFAHPVRITATARLGEGDVVDIEREAELGGAIHSKGVMILTAFLATRYAHAMPLSLSASLVFEQSYGPVEGDSASLAELCALLSALSGIPIRQSLAVTGSINQHGRVQAIGAVNEKIEGFFDVCNARGLTGEQGVLIPEANVKHLMLREDLLEAARAGRFRVWAVGTVDEAIELLTGVPAGEPDAQGTVPPGSVNYMVAAQLAELSMMRQEFAAGGTGRRKQRKE